MTIISVGTSDDNTAKVQYALHLLEEAVKGTVLPKIPYDVESSPIVGYYLPDKRIQVEIDDERGCIDSTIYLHLLDDGSVKISVRWAHLHEQHTVLFEREPDGSMFFLGGEYENEQIPLSSYGAAATIDLLIQTVENSGFNVIEGLSRILISLLVEPLYSLDDTLALKMVVLTGDGDEPPKRVGSVTILGNDRYHLNLFEHGGHSFIIDLYNDDIRYCLVHTYEGQDHFEILETLPNKDTILKQFERMLLANRLRQK